MSTDYQDAAKALRSVLDGRTGVKNAIFNAKPRNLKRCYGLVMEANKRLDTLKKLAKLLGPEGKDADQAMVLILLQEHLFGKGKGIVGGGHLKRLIVSKDAELKKAVKNMPQQQSELRGIKAEDPSASWPRYVRVNTLLSSVEDVIAAVTVSDDAISKDGSSKKDLSSSELEPSPTSAASQLLGNNEVSIDAHLPMVLCLPSDAHKRLSLHTHPLVTGGRVVLQDKASAIPPYALLADVLNSSAASAESSSNSSSGTPMPLCPGAFDAIDACAAPGNKTTQLAALLAQLSNSCSDGSINNNSNASSNSGGAGGAKAGKKRKRPADGEASSSVAAASGSATAVPRVWAFDRSAPRLETLRQRVALALERTPIPSQQAPPKPVYADGGGSGRGKGKKAKPDSYNNSSSSSAAAEAILSSTTVATHGKVEVACCGQDFTSLDPADPRFARVRVVLLDPSCSGSGMVKSHGPLQAKASSSSSSAAASAPSVPPSEAGRVASLAAFQLSALCHALSFPQVARVSYSTCSVYAEEDECVVRDALRKFNASGATDAVSGRPVRARLLHALPAWTNRGVPPPPLPADAANDGAAAADDEEEGVDYSACIRCNPDADKTGGFFVAVIHKYLL